MLGKNQLQRSAAILAALLTTLTLWPAVGFSQHRFGAGLVLGDPTGLTAKYVLSRSTAVDAALSFGRHKFYVHSTWQVLRPTHTSLDNFPLTWYLGIGPRLLQHDHHRARRGHDHEDETHLGARVPLGIRMNFQEPRIELFGEISLTMDVIPETELDFDFGIGARYYF